MVFEKIIKEKEGGYIIKTWSFLATFYTHSAETVSQVKHCVKVLVLLYREVRALMPESSSDQA